jgi:hypothetical protein
MPNGQQLKVKNYHAFLDWFKSKTDEEFKQLVCRGVLNRVVIAQEIGFAKSVLAQNPDVKEALGKLEERLRGKGILPPKAIPTDCDGVHLAAEPDSPKRKLDQARIKRLEGDLAAMRAERDLWRDRAERYEALDRTLMASGRVPR